MLCADDGQPERAMIVQLGLMYMYFKYCIFTFTGYFYF